MKTEQNKKIKEHNMEIIHLKQERKNLFFISKIIERMRQTEEVDVK